MKFVERLHEAHGGSHRLRVLGEIFAELIPRDASLLDVGCGDGLLTARIRERRSDVSFSGLDVLVRSDARIPVEPFDGHEIPHPDDAFDAVLFSDVLHHCEDPQQLLGEAARVARRCVLIKDHTLRGPLSGPLLRFMDDVGNRRFGVALPYNYWEEDRWRAAFRELGLSLEAWLPKLGLYPGPLDWLFGRSLHFVAKVGVGAGVRDDTVARTGG